MDDMTYRSCVMFTFDTPYTEPDELFELEEKRISEYLRLIDERK
jgi:hypothetical protein